MLVLGLCFVPLFVLCLCVGGGWRVPLHYIFCTAAARGGHLDIRFIPHGPHVEGFPIPASKRRGGSSPYFGQKNKYSSSALVARGLPGARARLWNKYKTRPLVPHRAGLAFPLTSSPQNGSSVFPPARPPAAPQKGGSLPESTPGGSFASLSALRAAAGLPHGQARQPLARTLGGSPPFLPLARFVSRHAARFAAATTALRACFVSPARWGTRGRVSNPPPRRSTANARASAALAAQWLQVC